MKHILFVLLTLCCIEVADAQTFGYSYGAGRDDVKRQTPIVEPGTERPEDVWAVSGNLQPFGTCANDLDTPPYGPSLAVQHASRKLRRNTSPCRLNPRVLRVPVGANRLPLADKKSL